jgi:hypothetical protein
VGVSDLILPGPLAQQRARERARLDADRAHAARVEAAQVTSQLRVGLAPGSQGVVDGSVVGTSVSQDEALAREFLRVVATQYAALIARAQASPEKTLPGGVVVPLQWLEAAYRLFRGGTLPQEVLPLFEQWAEYAGIFQDRAGIEYLFSCDGNTGTVTLQTTEGVAEGQIVPRHPETLLWWQACLWGAVLHRSRRLGQLAPHVPTLCDPLDRLVRMVREDPGLLDALPLGVAGALREIVAVFAAWADTLITPAPAGVEPEPMEGVSS